jgi:Bifunctional DNA primase/polymerase, N-terminal/Primase C terminal 1 (PriCT-1)
MRTDPQNERGLLTAALDYARLGWSILPLHSPLNRGCSCKKSICTNCGKHPRTRHGVMDATTNEDQIREWWAAWPNANIGVACGAASGLLVVDIDDGSDGAGSLSLFELEKLNGALPSTLMSLTGTGRHIYFRYPGRAITNSVSKIGIGMDVRCDGGYVVAPPSLHATGAMYRWANQGTDVVDPPGWLVGLVCEDKPGQAQERTVQTSDTAIPIGSRNDALATLAGRLRAQGMDQQNIEIELLEANATKLAAPLPAQEVCSIGASISRYPRGGPKLPWLPFYTGDWLACDAVRFGRDYQRGWHISLLVECWRRGGMLPDDPDTLWMWAGAISKAEFEKNGDHLLVLGEFESDALPDGSSVLSHPSLTGLFEKQATKYRQQCDAARKSAAKRTLADREDAGS